MEQLFLPLHYTPGAGEPQRYRQAAPVATPAQEARRLVSSAAWAPGKHGPNGEWERASRSTKRPVLVCNRTGFDVLDFGAGQSIVAADGSIVYCHTSADPACVLVDWDSRALVDAIKRQARHEETNRWETIEFKLD